MRNNFSRQIYTHDLQKSFVTLGTMLKFLLPLVDAFSDQHYVKFDWQNLLENQHKAGGHRHRKPNRLGAPAAIPKDIPAGLEEKVLYHPRELSDLDKNMLVTHKSQLAKLKYCLQHIRYGVKELDQNAFLVYSCDKPNALAGKGLNEKSDLWGKSPRSLKQQLQDQARGIFSKLFVFACDFVLFVEKSCRKHFLKNVF